MGAGGEVKANDSILQQFFAVGRDRAEFANHFGEHLGVRIGGFLAPIGLVWRLRAATVEGFCGPTDRPLLAYMNPPSDCSNLRYGPGHLTVGCMSRLGTVKDAVSRY
jgi:hypothetical protein